MRERILVNDRCLYLPAAGVRIYLENLLAHWPRDDVEPIGFCTQVRTFFQRRGRSGRVAAVANPLRLERLSELHPPQEPRQRLPEWLRRARNRVYPQAFARELSRGGYGAYFEPNHLAVPTAFRPVVTTIHDLSVLEHPEWHPPERVAQWERGFADSMACSTHWIAVSQFTRRRIMEVLGIPAAKISAIPEAARPLPYPAAQDVARAKAELQLPERYILHLGTIEPRKNIGVLLDAYAALPGAVRQAVPLVLAGAVGWGAPAFWQSLIAHPMAKNVFCVGPVSDRAAAVLLAGATALVAPSFYEGFGLPILEAMACGTPVICSAIEAFAEVAADAAEQVEPVDVAGWAQAIQRAASDADWAAERRRRGIERAALFSWKHAAQEHARVIANTTVAPSANV